MEPRFSFGRMTLGEDGRLSAEHVWIDPLEVGAVES
jgi:hypothetical protein